MTYRIGNVTAGLMIGVALLVDGIQFLLTLTVIGSVVAMFVSVFVWISFVIWFALHRVSYFDRGAATRGLILLGSVIVELIPMINALPATTLGVAALIFHTRIQDKKNMKREQARTSVRTDIQAQRRQEAIALAREKRTARQQAANDNSPQADMREAA